MLTEEQKKQIILYVQKFRENVMIYLQNKSKLEELDKEIEMKNKELLKVTEEERKLEVALEVLYGQTKKESISGKIEREIKVLQENSETIHNNLTELTKNLLDQMRELPIPADLESHKTEDSNIVFPFFEGAELGEEGIEVICNLFGQKLPLKFDDVIIMPDRLVVINAFDKKGIPAADLQPIWSTTRSTTWLGAVSKIVNAINGFRVHVEDISKSYKHVDEMIDRLMQSKLYAAILVIIKEKGIVSSEEISKTLNVKQRAAYDACYNLTRSNWSPNPIKKASSGKWELTRPAGEILVNRLLEKHPEVKSVLSSKENALGQKEE